MFSDNEDVLRSPATDRRDKCGFMWELEPTQEPGAAVSRRASLGANKRRGPQTCAQRGPPTTYTDSGALAHPQALITATTCLHFERRVVTPSRNCFNKYCKHGKYFILPPLFYTGLSLPYNIIMVDVFKLLTKPVLLPDD